MAEGDLAQGKLATDHVDLIDECRTRLTFCQQANGVNRQEFESDKRFVSGEQWDPTVRDERFSDRRPCLTVNITDSICRRVVNSCRENRPRIVTHAVGNGASVQTAKVYNGLIRHIEAASHADYWYDTGVENSVHGGFGWLGVDAEYISDDSFDQDLRIVGWTNPLMCYADPNSRAIDGSDMEFFLETQYMRRAEYRLKFGEIDGDGWKYVGAGDDVPDWSNKEEIRICKYWRVERKKDELLALPDGRIGYKSELGALNGLTSFKTRTVYRKRIRCYLLTAFKVLSEADWPGKWIPRVPIYGRRTDLNGKMQLKGMVRDLKDPARIYNYAKTAETEIYAMMPKAQWVGAAGFMEGKEAAWRDANRKPIVALEYVVTKGEDGERDPPPQRLDPPAVNQGFAEWSNGSKSDFLHVAGMPHDPEMDKKGEVISGIALKRREGIADVSNFDFYDNLTRALRQVGRILVDLIPHYYDTPRVLRIIQEDGKPEQVQVNAPQMDPMTQAVMKIENDLTVGDYEVVIDTGPGYQTKRQESAEALLEVLATPLGQMVAQTAGDKVLRQFDFADADGIADRLMGIIPAAQAEAMPGLDPKAKAIVGALQQQLQQMQHQLAAAHLELEDKRGIETMKQKEETQRVHMRETGATERELIKIGEQHYSAASKAATAHNTAELGAATQIIVKGMEHKHEARMGERELQHAEASQDKELTHDAAKTERTLQSAERTAQRTSE